MFSFLRLVSFCIQYRRLKKLVTGDKNKKKIYEINVRRVLISTDIMFITLSFAPYLVFIQILNQSWSYFFELLIFKFFSTNLLAKLQWKPNYIFWVIRNYLSFVV